MKEKSNLLIVYNYNRHDFLSYFHACKDDFNFYFAEFVSPKEEQNEVYKSYGTAIYWGDFRDVFQLLETIQPQKVLFHYIESNFHVLLNVACKSKGIPTFIIDHGLRDVNINIRLKEHLTPKYKKGPLRKLLEKITTLIPRLKARRYLLRSINKLPEAVSSEVKLYFNERKLLNASFLVIPNAFITISSQTYRYYQTIYNLPENYKYHIVGIPAFDKLAHIKPGTINNKAVLFIDQGLGQVGVFGWDANSYNTLLSDFMNVCNKLGYHVYLKPHPRKIINADFLKDDSAFTVVDDKDTEKLLPEIKIIVGFTSTYLLPLAALPHTVVITLENHPIGKLDVSKSWIDAGVAHPVYSLEELPWALENIELLHQKQLPNKKQFEKDWLYKFDGKAGERLRDILLSDEL